MVHARYRDNGIVGHGRVRGSVAQLTMVVRSPTDHLAGLSPRARVVVARADLDDWIDAGAAELRTRSATPATLLHSGEATRICSAVLLGARGSPFGASDVLSSLQYGEATSK